MNITFNENILYLLDMRTSKMLGSGLNLFISPKTKKFELIKINQPTAIIGQLKKKYLLYGTNDQMGVIELGTLDEKKIEPKNNKNVFMAKFKKFYVTTSKIELAKIYKKYCLDMKNHIQTQIKDAKRLNAQYLIDYYEDIIQNVEETYHDFLIKLKEL